jgi:peptide/nickel transport system substrate-binding protein
MLLLAVTLAACAPTAPPPGAEQQPTTADGAALRSAPGRVLRLVVRYEVVDLATKRLAPTPFRYAKRPFNAALALIDSMGSVRPCLAEALPELNTATWKVFPDGRMETTYRLKPDLTWHDGTPLVADDFVFAWRVYTAPGLGAFTGSPQDQMEDVLAPDPRTLVIRWRAPYGDAGALADRDLDALPGHILAGPFAAYQQDPTTQDAFLGHPFWSTRYVGLGPYQLDRWELGSFLEGVAFAGYALGQPKIPRVIIHFIGDGNTVVSNLLAGTVDLAVDGSISFDQAIALQRVWDPGQRGIVLTQPSSRHGIFVQFRPELVKTRALLDLRVRQGLAHAIDREPLGEALFDGQGLMSDHWVPPQTAYAADTTRAVTHYPFDPRRTEQLFSEAGLTRDRAGVFTTAGGEGLRPEFLANASPLEERELSLIQDAWARLGIELEPRLLPAAQARLNESRTMYPDLYATAINSQEARLDSFSAAQIASAATRWAGNNTGGWSHPDFERWWDAYRTTLDRSQRNQQIVEMMKVLSEQLPGLMLYFTLQPIAHGGDLHGPAIGTAETLALWNLHEFELR